MKRPAEYYTLWNQAVEAVEIYLARNPLEFELDDESYADIFKATVGFIQDDMAAGIEITQDSRQHAVKRALDCTL